MKAKHKRLIFILGCLVMMGIGATAILSAFSDNLVFFFTPTQWHEKHSTTDGARDVRIGGLVKKGSVVNRQEGVLQFTVTDYTSDLPVRYKGLVPNLFREGQGVVAQGKIVDGVLIAHTILAKHDENYMPREVMEALKASGRWQEGEGYRKVKP